MANQHQSQPVLRLRIHRRRSGWFEIRSAGVPGVPLVVAPICVGQPTSAALSERCHKERSEVSLPNHNSLFPAGLDLQNELRGAQPS